MKNQPYMTRSITLLTASGNRNLILELVDFFNGGDRFTYRPEAERIRRQFAGRPVTALYLVCTTKAMDELDPLREDLAREYPEVCVYAVELDCDDIGCGKDDLDMRERVYSVVRRMSGPDLVIASGGRKTITQRIIEAGLLHGCAGYLSITAPPGKEKDPDVRTCTEEFNVLWIPGRQFAEERRSDLIRDGIGDTFRSVYFLPRMVLDRLRDEREAVGRDPARKDDDLDWLRRLPKADLHCHLGGCQDETVLRELAAVLLDDLDVSSEERAAIRAALEEAAGVPPAVLTSDVLRGLRPERNARPIVHCLQNLDFLSAKVAAPKYLCAAVLVESLDVADLRSLCRDGRVGENGAVRWPEEKEIQGGNRLDWYMACGDLGGSTLLQTEHTLRLAVRRLLETASAENVRYLEIRCSPENYTKAGRLSITGAMEILLDEARAFLASVPEMRVNFLVMATRHKARAAMCRHVAAAILYADRERKGPRVVGFDLAGQERDHDPSLFVEEFQPLHRNFMNITIHAGEMADDDKIWEAIYRLHAKRIGHGLRLIDNRLMMDFVRDHQLAIEMCPSSNMQTNTFRDFWMQDGPDDPEIREYPLARYLEHGIRVTVNTDNRFISQTTLSNEYLQAARMTPGGLTRWQVLKLVKNGFKAAFLPKDEKDALLKEVDEEVFRLLLDDAFAGGRSAGKGHE